MLRISCTPSHLFLLWLLPATLALTQTPAPAAPALATYTAPDGSASASLPVGWSVTRSAGTVIVMTGPSGETINLGNTLIVKDAPYTPGQTPANGIDLSIPNSASLAEKFTDIIQTAQSVAKASPPQTSIASNTPLTPRLGFACATLDGTYTGDKGTFTFHAVVCSLPVDTGGTYKVIVKLWRAPPAVASQEKALAETVLSSYRVPQPWLQKKLAPHYAPPVALPADPATECFDLSVLRDVPQNKLPDYCSSRLHSDPQ